MPTNLAVPGASPPAPAGDLAPPRSLTRRQKAAIVVRLLQAEGISVSLAKLPDTLQAALTREIGSMRYVDRATLGAVIAEFVSELDSVGLAFPSDIGGALSLLDGTISTETAAKLRREAGLSTMADPWGRLAELDATRLVSILEEESIEIGAVMLSKLKVSKSAELLGLLPGERARRIAFAMSQTGAVAPATVERIGAALAAQIDAAAPRAFDDAPVERIGAILNSSPAVTRDEVLEGLDAEDQDFAEQVRKAIFTFANIPDRIDPRDVAKIVRGVDAANLTTALGAASATEGDAPAAEFILANMSQRMAAQLREEIAALGKIKANEGEAAMAAVVAVIRELEAAGEIILVAEED